MFYSEALNGILLYSSLDELYAPWKQTDSKSTSGFWGGNPFHVQRWEEHFQWSFLKTVSSVTGVSKMVREMSLASTVDHLTGHGISVCKFSKNHKSMPNPE